MTEWRIRRAVADDAPAVVALEREAFGATSWGARSVADGLTERHVATLVAVAVAAAEAAPAGFAFWRRIDDEAEILSLGVAPGKRRLGCARALIEAMIEDARSQGLRKLFLEVDVGNTAAAALYTAAGFETIGRRKRYYRSGGDALVMRLDL